MLLKSFLTLQEEIKWNWALPKTSARSADTCSNLLEPTAADPLSVSTEEDHTLLLQNLRILLLSEQQTSNNFLQCGACAVQISSFDLRQ